MVGSLFQSNKEVDRATVKNSISLRKLQRVPSIRVCIHIHVMRTYVCTHVMYMYMYIYMYA
jgi:hypothetical protein